jgi:hypothetical protein
VEQGLLTVRFDRLRYGFIRNSNTMSSSRILRKAALSYVPCLFFGMNRSFMPDDKIAMAMSTAGSEQWLLEPCTCEHIVVCSICNYTAFHDYL